MPNLTDGIGAHEHFTMLVYRQSQDIHDIDTEDLGLLHCRCHLDIIVLEYWKCMICPMPRESGLLVV